MAGNFEMTNVKTLHVTKDRLLDTLRENLEHHRIEYREAVPGYN